MEDRWSNGLSALRVSVPATEAIQTAVGNSVLEVRDADRGVCVQVMVPPYVREAEVKFLTAMATSSAEALGASLSLVWALIEEREYEPELPEEPDPRLEEKYR